jgi:hypothetical protein
MPKPSPERLRLPLAPPAQSLQAACHQAGLDEGGARCARCRLRKLCRDETRWVVSRSARGPDQAGRRFRAASLTASRICG